MINHYALIIGVGKYSNVNITNLPASVTDSEKLRGIIVDPEGCGYLSNHVQVLTNELATKDRIYESIRFLIRQSDSEATILIYFSGHGGRLFENGNWYTYLCTHETDPTNLPGSAFSGLEFSDLIGRIRSKKIVLLLDSCHAGGSIQNIKLGNMGLNWKSGLTEAYYENLSRGSGRIVIASSKEDQYSYVKNDLSLFTYYLIEAFKGKAAVRGDNMIRILDVFHYVNEAVQQEQPQQVPILKAMDLGLNFVVARFPKEKIATSKNEVTSIKRIREQIIKSPLEGAIELSHYLEKDPKWSFKRNEVDLKRMELDKLQNDLRLFGHDTNLVAAKNRITFFLLSTCLELQKH
jgi:uncharacterized caspase-like protein